MKAVCKRCDGCGRIADSEDGLPWTRWTELPLHSSIALLAGIVRPIPCPKCAGTGEQENRFMKTVRDRRCAMTLRPEHDIVIFVPEDLTPAEAARIGRWIETLGAPEPGEIAAEEKW
jgi:hypothetical protein